MTDQLTIVLTALEGYVDGLLKRLVLNTVANLVAPPALGGTPVDTGWARANWVPRIGSSTTGAVGSRESVSTSEQQAGVASIVMGYGSKKGPAYITNHVPYIGRLNEGHSKQAPRGFVQAAIQRAVEQSVRGT